MKHNAFMRCLPLLATLLGRKYGVTVLVGGTEAYTDGRHIQLPALPVDGDTDLVNLVRAYVDHETAHIRFTDFTCIDDSVTPFEKHVWNILEDWRVEKSFTQRYPGSKHHFQWLIRHLFLSQRAELPTSPESLVLGWLLFVVRSWDVPELKIRVKDYVAALDGLSLSMRSQIESVLESARLNCPDSYAALVYAKEIVKCMSKPDESSKNQIDGVSEDIPFSYSEAVTQLKAVLKGGGLSGDTVCSVGDYAKSLLQVHGQKLPTGAVSVASVGESAAKPIDVNMMKSIQRITAGMQARFHAFMQAKQLIRTVSGRKGRLESRNLYKHAIGRSDVFARRREGETVDTAFHILLDSSGSMGNKMSLATSACYAVAKALEGNNVNVAVTSFPARNKCRDSSSAIAPLIRHGERVHSRMGVSPRYNSHGRIIMVGASTACRLKGKEKNCIDSY